MNAALWVVQALLALAFLASGAMKLVTPIDDLVASGMSFAENMPWLVRFIGVAEVLGAIGLIVPAGLRIQPILTPIAAAALAVVMLLAVITHVAMDDASGMFPALILGLMAAFVAWGRFRIRPILPRELARS